MRERRPFAEASTPSHDEKVLFWTRVSGVCAVIGLPVAILLGVAQCQQSSAKLASDSRPSAPATVAPLGEGGMRTASVEWTPVTDTAGAPADAQAQEPQPAAADTDGAGAPWTAPAPVRPEPVATSTPAGRRRSSAPIEFANRADEGAVQPPSHAPGSASGIGAQSPMKWIRLALVAGLIAAPLAARAQDLGNQGRPDGGGSAALIVDSTDPVLYPCNYYDAKSCFRMYFQLKPAENVAINVASIDNSGDLYETRAFAGTGSSCVAKAIGGLPRGGLTNHGEPIWSFSTPFAITQTKPATFMAEFRCDGALLAGDEVTVQITFAADPSGREIEIVRYVFPKLVLKPARR